MNNTKNRHSSLYNFVLTSLFIAIILILAFTPIGLIDLPFIKATILHIPVIMGSIILGPKNGALLGFVFGLSSLIKNTLKPSVLSFAFSPLIPVLGTDKGSIWAIVICFVPRILVGITPYFTVQAIEKLFRKKNLRVSAVSCTAAGIIGSFTNTILVMGLIFLIFRQEYAAANSIPVNEALSAILVIVGKNGVPEAFVSAALTPPVCLAADKFLNRGTQTKVS